jgi:Zn ribbon nucleic-acid-binding protein
MLVPQLAFIRCEKCRGIDISIVWNTNNLTVYRCDHCGHRWVGSESGRNK